MADRRVMKDVVVVRTVLVLLWVGCGSSLANSIRQEVKALAGGSVSLRYNF
jgi:hypothetical protein